MKTQIEIDLTKHCRKAPFHSQLCSYNKLQLWACKMQSDHLESQIGPWADVIPNKVGRAMRNILRTAVLAGELVHASPCFGLCYRSCKWVSLALWTLTDLTQKSLILPHNLQNRKHITWAAEIISIAAHHCIRLVGSLIYFSLPTISLL